MVGMRVSSFMAALGRIFRCMRIPVNIGKYALDCTGFALRTACIVTNEMFEELFSLQSLGSPQLINIGTYVFGTDPNDLTNNPVIPGDKAQLFCTKINANFTALFTSISQELLQEFILLGGEPGMIIGQNSPIIGTGDPGRTIWYKVNQNFQFLYAQIGGGVNPFAWTTETGAFWTTESGNTWTTQ